MNVSAKFVDMFINYVVIRHNSSILQMGHPGSKIYQTTLEPPHDA
jgi:hypothetical protein